MCSSLTGRSAYTVVVWQRPTGRQPRTRQQASIYLCGADSSWRAWSWRSPAPRTRAARSSSVQYVIDGDTVVLANGEHVRLVQIDAPEVQERECYGAASRATPPAHASAGLDRRASRPTRGSTRSTATGACCATSSAARRTSTWSSSARARRPSGSTTTTEAGTRGALPGGASARGPRNGAFGARARERRSTRTTPPTRAQPGPRSASEVTSSETPELTQPCGLRAAVAHK